MNELINLTKLLMLTNKKLTFLKFLQIANKNN